MMTFAGIEEKYAIFKNASIVLQCIPYDGTSTWGKGADKGPEAFLVASENMELYDIETDYEVYKKGIFLSDPILENKTPESMTDAVYLKTKGIIKTGKFPTFFGGEHSVSIGIIKAFSEKYSNLSVLQLDAHADLRKSYLGSENNHACALHKASKSTNLVQVGIRSMDICEKKYLDFNKCYFASFIAESNSWQQKSISQLGNDVYITIDLDVFDPSIMPSTGTPEPGGLMWYTVINYLREVFKTKNVVGFDIVELAPSENNQAPNFLAAKLYYKMLSYKFLENGK